MHLPHIRDFENHFLNKTRDTGSKVDLRVLQIIMHVHVLSIHEVLLYKWVLSALNEHQNLLQPLLSRLPVNNIPNSREVLRLAVLVLQVVRVLPGVNTKDGTELTDHGVLVGVCLDTDVASLHVLHQPCPAGALDAGQSGVEFAL
jgi:hypothetical protein